MALPACPDCSCIPGNIANDKFKQDVESVLCQTLTALGYEFPEGGCDPCSCIPGNIDNDKFKQDVEVLLCALLDAVTDIPTGISAVTDTNSIDLTITGGTTLSADSKISPDAGNQVSIHANGLFVPAPSVGDASTGAITTKTSNFPATTANYTILCDATSGPITITLPAVAGASTHILNIMKIDSSLNAVILDGNASETINGDLTKTITQQYTNLTVQCNGSAWYII